MFNFLRKFAKPKQELPRITLAELPSWIEQEQTKRKEAAQKAFDEQFHQHREQLGLLGTSVEALRNAQLMNKNIPERAKHVMEGNRDAFIRAVERIAHSISPPASIEDAPRYRAEVNTMLQDILYSANRPFQILQEFFAHETKEVLNQVHILEKQAIALSKINEEHKLGVLKSLSDELSLLNNFDKQQQEAREKIKRCNDEFSSLEREHKELQKRIGSLELSAEYSFLLDIKQKLQETTNEMKRERARVIEQFSALEPALKKYEHMTLHNRTLIKDYLANPIETLARDREFAVIGIISAMRREVEADRIDLKDRKKEKVLTVMSEFSREKLASFLKTYGALTQKQNALVADAQAIGVLSSIASLRESARMNEQKREMLHKELKNMAQLLERKPDYSKIEALAAQFSFILRK